MYTNNDDTNNCTCKTTTNNNKKKKNSNTISRYIHTPSSVTLKFITMLQNRKTTTLQQMQMKGQM